MRIRSITLGSVLLALVSVVIFFRNTVSDVPSSIIDPEHNITHGITYCDNQLCWNDIIVGASTHTQVRRYLVEMYGRRNIEADPLSISWDNDTDPNVISGYIEFDRRNLVNSVHLYFPRDHISVADLIELVGEPGLVNVVRAFSSEIDCAGTMIHHQDDGITSFLYPQGNSVGIDPQQSINKLILDKPYDLDDLRFTDSWQIEWQGYDYCDLIRDIESRVSDSS